MKRDGTDLARFVEALRAVLGLAPIPHNTANAHTRARRIQSGRLPGMIESLSDSGRRIERPRYPW